MQLSEAAELDVAEAALWYEAQRPGLEEEFLASLDATLERIAGNAELFSFIHRELRHALVRRFPYLVIFEISGDVATVIAVIHASRDPNEWQRRT